MDECNAYRVELGCYKAALPQCNGDKTCINMINAYLQDAISQAQKNCGKANNW